MNQAPEIASSDAVAEVSCRPLRCMFVAFRKLKSEADLLASLKRSGVTLPLSFLEDVNNWTSFALSQRILDQLSEDSGVSDFPRRAGLTLCTPEVLGFAHSAIKAFGTPRLVYQRVVDLTTQLNRIGALKVLSIDDNQIRLEYQSTIREQNHHYCEFRQGNLQSVPATWGEAPARLTELSCQARGDTCCSYVLEWKNPAAHRGTALGVAVGAVLGGALHAAGIVDAPVALACAGGGLLAGVVGALLDSRRELRERDKLLERQKTDLLEGVRSLTERYEQITELNRTLEEKVDERTAELASARDKLQAALAKAVALDRAKTQFFTNISHELRTPLTLILAPLETALQEWTDASKDARGQLQMMHRNGLRLLDNINQLLDLSRLDAGKTRLKLEEFDAPEMLRSLVEASQGLAKQRGIKLTFESWGETRAIWGDRDKLEKVALNLIGNALKFTRPTAGQPNAWVKVRCGPEGGRFAFDVSDSGIGIPQEQLGTIFERFSQVSGGDGREYGGSGIGLALAKELVEFHMGEITVKSLEGVGSTFSVRLPHSRASIPEDRLDRRRLQKQVMLDRRDEEEQRKLSQLFRDPEALEVVRDEEDEPSQPSVLQMPARLQVLSAATEAEVSGEEPPLTTPPEVAILGGAERPTLLLADDNADMIGYLTRLLRPDFHVLTANDGEQALALATRQRPSLIISDVMMPRMDGYQLLRKLRSTEETSHIPIILLTAKSEVAHKIQGLDQGADDYLAKPFNFLELKARVRALLRQRELERMLAEKNDYLAKLNFDLVLSKKEVFVQTVEAVTFALEAKDTYTHGHSYRVAQLAGELGREIKLSEAEVERVRLAALLHDVGKIGVREGVLNKPGRLTPEEYLEIQRHPEIGARILDGVRELKDVTRCIRYHHEAWDGSGYPGRLVAREIPLESRVIAVADTYDAMTSDRAYRKGLGHARAIEEIRNFAGRQFDPEIARAFIRRFETRLPDFPAFPSAFTTGLG